MLAKISDLWLRLVGVGFHLLYHQMAWSYDAVSWLVSLGEWRKWQLAPLDFIEGKRVLELAHGTGHLTAALAKAGYAVTALDRSPQMGRMARRRLKNGGWRCDFVLGRAQQLPFPRAHFHTVVTTFPTSFILQSQTLADIQRVLTPSGRLIIVPAARLAGRGPLQRLIEGAYALTGQGVADATLPALWQAQLEESGFHLTTHTVRLPRSEVILLVATPEVPIH